MTGGVIPFGTPLPFGLDETQNYDFLTSLLNGNINVVIEPGVADSDIEVGGDGGTATVVDSAGSSLYVWQQKNVVWTNSGAASGNTLFFQPDIGTITKSPVELVLNLLTGAGDNPWGGTLSVTKVDNVTVGSVNGEYIVANNDGDTIYNGFDAGTL
jgi:hypothetical protein